MSGLTVDVVGYDRLRANLKQLDEVKALRTHLFLPASQLGQEVARSGAPASMRKAIKRRASQSSARVFTTDYRLRFIEKGRRPGAMMPPVNNPAFRSWTERQGIPGEQVFAVARAIGKRGIKGRFFMKKAREAVEREMPRYIARVEREVERGFA